MLYAYCVYKDGSEELVDFEPVRGESSEAWSRFCGRLYLRGIRKVELVVSDDNKGLREAIATYWPGARHQFCIFHFLQNFIKLLKGIEPRRRRAIIEAVKGLYKSKDKSTFYGTLMKIMAI